MRGMTSYRYVAVLAILASSPIAAAAEPVKFAVAPTAKAVGEQTEITFTLSAPTDVEVSIIDKDGKVVRHLAAGMVGKDQAAPPLQPKSLAQRIVWDGKDDGGNPAAAVAPKMGSDPNEKTPGGQTPFSAPFSVRVRAGMTTTFGRMIGGSPYTGQVGQTPYRAPKNGIVVAENGVRPQKTKDIKGSDPIFPDGTLYVWMMSDIHSHGNSGLWPWHLRAFDKTGEYRKTLVPYPPSTDPAKASGMTLITTPDGAFTPANQNSLYPVFEVFGDEIVSRLVDGRIVFINSRDRVLNLFKPDGSNELKTVKMWSPKANLQCAYFLSIQVAVSPDGKYAYYSNVAGVPYDPKTMADIDARWPNGRVYRQDLSKPGSDPERFFDLTVPPYDKTVKGAWIPNAWNAKTAAGALDVDAKGNLLVCDLANQAIVELSAEGKQLSATPVAWPDRVIVSHKTDALYVVSKKFVESSGGEGEPALFKITGRGEKATVAAKLPLRGRTGTAITLDESGEKPVLWLAGGDDLVRVEDRGTELAVTGQNLLNRDPNAVGFVGYMDVDRDAELVYVTGSGSNVWRYNGETGEGGLLKLKAVDLAIGPKGMIYTWGVEGGYHGPIGRFTRDLKPAPLAAGAATYGALDGRAGRGSSVCGMDVDSKGRVYAVNGSNNCHLIVYDESGALVPYDQKITMRGAKGETQVPVAIDYVSGYGGAVRVNREGNIYILQSGQPKGTKPPAGYEKDEAYSVMMGTILKFGPKGGKRNVPLDDGGRGGDPLGFSGILATYPGCAPISGWRCDGACACVKPRFDVDDFGRLYIPNVVTFTVSVRDNAGNELAQFGHYGNFDCQGPKSAEPNPAIPFGWPMTVGASDRFIYVGDCLNHRIVRVDKTWAVEEKTELK